EYLLLCHRRAVLGGEAATEAFRAEGLGHSTGPDLSAAIVDHRKRHAVTAAALGALAELLRRQARPVNHDVDADQFALLLGPGLFDSRPGGVAGRPGVADCLQRLRLLPGAVDHGAGELLRADFLLAHAL